MLKFDTISVVVSRYQSHILLGIHVYSFRGVQSAAYFFPASHHLRPLCSAPQGRLTGSA